MARAGDKDTDAVLSDIEADDPAPLPEDVSVERFREALAELDREKRAREAAENSKSELQNSFNRLKVLAHEAIKKRDECTRQRDEALRSNEKLSAELDEAIRAKDEASKQRDEFAMQFDEAVKAKESLRSEIETAAQMLVTGIEKVSGKVSKFSKFSGEGLPRSQKYTGLPAVAYGVIKRSNDIVGELIRQIDSTSKSRNEAREQIELRNYEIAIEVSELESTISGLRDEVLKKSSAVENLEKCIEEKVCKILDMEKERNSAEEEASGLKHLVGEYDDKLRHLESKMDSQRPLLVDQFNYISKVHDQIDKVIKIIDARNVDELELSESLLLPQETDMEENIRASLAGMESICELTRIVVEKRRDLVVERHREVKALNETVSQLVKEKEHIGVLLRSALSRRMSDRSSKTNELLQVAENGLREAGIDFSFSNHHGDKNFPVSNDKVGAMETDDDEIYTLAGALENIIKQSQLEIIELQHSVYELRAKKDLLREHVEAQGQELNHSKQYILELEDKERVANENIEGLMMDIATAEEEITRWKAAAQEEADAGKAVEQEFLTQLSALRKELKEEKEAVVECQKTLKFKAETATAAMAARDAVEKSLRLADVRASRLRDRVVELTRQLEELDTPGKTGPNGPRYVCWPWQWLGLDFAGFHQSDTQQQSSNEMELSEALL